MIDDTEGDDWIFRRDRRIRRPIQSLTGRASRIGCAVLAPDVQLLYKSRGLREKDVADLRAVLPCLLAAERDWLRTALETVAPRHPWIPEL